jgi:hypothetical protein
LFVRGRGDSAIQHHSKTLVARLCIGLQGIIAASLLAGVGIFRVGHQQYLPGADILTLVLATICGETDGNESAAVVSVRGPVRASRR